MRIWIDLANSPHVPFFGALVPRMRARGHEVGLTARDFAQTLELARGAGFDAEVVGGHGGRSLAGKARNIAGRALALARWARGRRFDLAVSHNSYAHVAAARLLGVRGVTLMDYEHQPANHLAFRLASRVVVPEAFPEADLRRCGAGAHKVRRYRGIKEDVYLADFAPDPAFAETLRTTFGVNEEDVLVVARPPARDALYHRFENGLFDYALSQLVAQPRVKAVVLARGDAQHEALSARHADAPNVFVPRAALDGANLVARADLVLSAGGGGRTARARAKIAARRHRGGRARPARRQESRRRAAPRDRRPRRSATVDTRRLVEPFISSFVPSCLCG